MSLKLFRSTGYASLLTPGETRVATHPGWLVLAVSLWIGFVCNPDLWRALGGAGGLARAATSGLCVAAGAGLLLSLMAWRRTFKPVAAALLLLAALAASTLWSDGRALEHALMQLDLRLVLPTADRLPTWRSLALLLALALPPLVWLWRVGMRRLDGQAQLTANMAGAGLGGLGLVISELLMALAAPR